MSIQIVGTFSWNMIALPATVRTTELPVAAVRAMDLTSNIGNPATAFMISEILGKELHPSRTALTTDAGDCFIVAVLLNSSGQRRIDSMEDARALTPYTHYNYQFLLVEVIK